MNEERERRKEGQRRMKPRKPIAFFPFFFALLLHSLPPPLFAAPISIPHLSSPPPLPPANLSLPSDALALLAFKQSADVGNKLHFFSLTKPYGYCQWEAVKCVNGKVVRFVIEGFPLKGKFGENTLSRLDQLRVLSLGNNSLVGPIPNLSGLLNLKSLFLDHNFFTGNFPPSILSLHRIRTVDLSYNNLTGPLPALLTALDRLYYLRLESNTFNGSIPPLNQSSLRTFNVSNNNLTGAIPVTIALSGFATSSFSSNSGLCGVVIHKECSQHLPFFDISTAPPPTSIQSDQTQGSLITSPSSPRKHKKTALTVGFCILVFLVISGSILGVLLAVKKRRKQRRISTPPAGSTSAAAAQYAETYNEAPAVETEEKVCKSIQALQVGKSGSLVFCAGESQIYTVEQLMRASAEMLGRGTVGTTYKAVLDNHLIVSVKRLDAGKMGSVSKEMYDRHMLAVGGLRHPNLVPLRAFFQAKEERLLIYDYQPNGSLFSLIHGSRSTRAKPLHWTSCLKIAEDVAQGLAYVHQASRLVHGNIKSSNVLLGADFEACLTDYCLSALAEPPEDDDTGYRAPEIRKTNRRGTPKSDVYAFGVLLLELLTGKTPLQHPFVTSADLPTWVRSVREEEGSGEDDRLAMLLDIATACVRSSSEQRPTMWQVLKMIQEVKETEMGEYELDSTAFS